jgi:hypothetical protein
LVVSENVALIVTHSHPDDLVPFPPEIRISKGHSFRAPFVQPIVACARGAIVVHFGVRYMATSTTANGCADHHTFHARSVLVTVQGSSLRAARACARPAGLDGACAQIRSWQLRDGRRGDDAKLD